MNIVYAVRRVTKNGKPYKSCKVKIFWHKEDAEQYIKEQEKLHKNKPYFAIYSANAETVLKVLSE